MTAAEKALAALEVAGKAATPRPWHWSDNALGHFTANKWDAVIWPANAESVDRVPLRAENAQSWWRTLLGSCGNESESCAMDNARLIALAVNLSAPLAAVARAAMAYRAIEAAWRKQMDRLPKNGGDDAFQEALASAHHEHVIEMSEAQSTLFAALDALEAAAEGVV